MSINWTPTKRFFAACGAIAWLIGTLFLIYCLFGANDASANDMPPADCPVCQTIPAIKTETVTQNTQTTSQQNTTSTTHVVESSKVSVKIAFYEKIKHVRVAVHMDPYGIKNPQSRHSCTDPIKKGWIKAGGLFSNTRKNGSRFADKWVKGLFVCDWHIVTIGGVRYVEGTKSNCRNTKIRIRIGGKKVTWKYIPVETYKSYKEFLKVYNKWVTQTTTSDTSTSTTTTPNVTVTYSCPQGWTLVNSGDTHSCTKCEHHQCEQPCPEGSTWNADHTQCVKDGNTTPPPPDPAPGPNPDPSDPDNSHACYDKNTGAPVEPVIVNGVALCPSGSYGNP